MRAQIVIDVSRQYLCIFLPVPVAQSIAHPKANPGVASLIPAWPHTFVEIDREISSLVILLLLIQEGALSVTRESMCTKY